jgi:hypothetical protein
MRTTVWLAASSHSGMRRRLIVRLFVSPLVVDDDGRARVQNDQGHPVVQEGAAREFLVVRAHNTGKRPVQVARVEFVNAHTGNASNLSWLSMPKAIPPDEVQLWYTKVAIDPEDEARIHPKGIFARVVLTDGKTFDSPRYSSLLGYLNPLDPIAGRGAYS